MSIVGGAHADIRRFVAVDNDLCGIQLAYGTDATTGEPNPVGGTVDPHDGEVFGNPIGVNSRPRRST